ncbi:MAG: SPOR domain-containing protein [Deltaproteobacteria bacterium]|nr:SPOR domain-containing protein [Deltaproteobacteria bacterium]
MSKLYEALERAQLDRAASGLERDQRGADRPRISSGAAGWWKGLIVGGVIGFLAAALSVRYLLDGQGSAVPARPSGEQTELLAVQSQPAAVADAPREPTTEALAEAGGDLSSEAPPIAARLEQPADDVANAAPGPPESPHAQPSDSVASASPRTTFWVQVGAFKNRDNAVHVEARLTRLRYPSTIDRSRSATAPWVVQVGDYSDRHAAEAARGALARAGFPGFVTHGEN